MGTTTNLFRSTGLRFRGKLDFTGCSLGQDEGVVLGTTGDGAVELGEVAVIHLKLVFLFGKLSETR